MKYAERKHNGQVRKGSGSPYFHHPLCQFHTRHMRHGLIRNNQIEFFRRFYKGFQCRKTIRKGCDLAVEFNIIDQLGIERALKKENLSPLDIIYLDEISQKPLSITKEKDFGKYLMITSANMKLTIDKETKIIVNISEI